ncbi:MAG: hypothetical protein EA397_08405 [Deltaproteobacteria bacterium]|nr:MAG: hypothetical protein EA397_08405 [Deltaproteobacteria bacterium]
MNKYLPLGIGLFAVLGLSACDEELFETDTEDIFCMEEVDENDVPLVLPNDGQIISTTPDAVFQDCEEYTGDVLITYVPPFECGASGWSIEFEHRGPSSAADLYMHDSSGGNAEQPDWWWGEVHPIDESISGPNGWYERYELNLPVVTDFSDAVEGVNSYHQCAANNDTTLVYGIEVFSIDDETEVADCVVISTSGRTDGYVQFFDDDYPHMVDCDLIEGWIVSDGSNNLDSSDETGTDTSANTGTGTGS